MGSSTPVKQPLNRSTLTVLGTVNIPVRLLRSTKAFPTEFYVVTDFHLPCDGLLGNVTLADNHVDVSPERHAIIYRDRVFTELHSLSPLLSPSDTNVVPPSLHVMWPPFK